jgi:single-stranded DNA-specific DHH superfamily exonuclease
VASDRFPQQRWHIAAPQPELARLLSQAAELPELLAQVLLNRGVTTPSAAEMFLNPELQILPSPLEEFADLPMALELLLRAIAERQYIAICGDYDADGMTSTALLLRALRYLGATVEYAIPSRMQEGYGINRRIIEEFHAEGVGLILTVDNGIAAYEPIARARELGMAVIVTDHHDIPPDLPPANAILNPKLIRPESPYRGAAGVGVAYILAVCLAQSLQKTQDLTTPLIELFTLGTIADLAPLTGVNRRWVKRGLKLLPKSRMAGIQALIQVAGLSQEKALKPEAIGFRLGPRINAIGRLADPQIVIELLTTDEEGRALELAMKCEQVNQLRQRLCELIEQEAIAYCLETGFDPQQERVLVIVQPSWHHGVIGIVASRLVERYGVPVFIGTIETPEGEASEAAAPQLSEAPESPEPAKIRGSARGIPEFDVFEALQFCRDLLGKFGGHRAAGGFTFEAANLEAVRQRLRQFAHQSLRPEHLKPLVSVDAESNFRDLTLDLYEQMDVLHPCGIENPDPIFWTAHVQVIEQRQIGQNQAHLKVTLAQISDPSYSLRAIAWRWGVYYPLPSQVDVAYKLKLNDWQGVRSLELELVGIRESQTGRAAERHSLPQLPQKLAQKLLPDLEAGSDAQTTARLEIFGRKPRVSQITLDSEQLAVAKPPQVEAAILDSLGTEDAKTCFEMQSICSPQPLDSAQLEFYHSRRKYTGSFYWNTAKREIKINTPEGNLILQPEHQQIFWETKNSHAPEIDLSQPHYFNLVRSALTAVELVQRQQLIEQQEQQIAALSQQLEQMRQQMEQQQIFQQLAQPAPADLSIPELLPELPPELPLELKPEDPKPWLKAQLGEIVWQQLDSRSQKDLTAAYKKYALIQDRLADAAARSLDDHSIHAAENLTDSSTDYSDVGLRLCSVIEREVIQPFFKELYQFLLAAGEPCEVGNVALRARKKYTLGMLPPLLAATWQSFDEEALGTGAGDLYSPVEATQIDPTDRETVQIFLAQWQHPLSRWLDRPNLETVASAIAQIDRLLTLAADAESQLYGWQFQHLQKLVMGDLDGAMGGAIDRTTGLLQQIYAAKLDS